MGMSKKPVKSEREKAVNRARARFRDKDEYANLICRKKFEDYYNELKENKGIENNDLGRRIEHIRTTLKLNTTQFALKTGIHRSTINDIEKGNKKGLPKISTVLQIVQKAEIEVDDFISLPDDFNRWKRVITQKYAPFDIDGFINVEIEKEYDLDVLLETILKLLDVKAISTTIDGKEKYLSQKHIEVLRRDIFQSFEIVKYLLSDGT